MIAHLLLIILLVIQIHILFINIQALQMLVVNKLFGYQNILLFLKNHAHFLLLNYIMQVFKIVQLRSIYWEQDHLLKFHFKSLLPLYLQKILI